MPAIWNTKAGDLGIIPSESYFELQLDAVDLLAGPVTYTLIAGDLPTGLTINSGGFISGNPLTDTANVQTELFTTKAFTVRCTTSDNKVNDRYFTLSVTNYNIPVISPNSTILGNYIAGDYANIQLTASDDLTTANVVFTVANGSLPPGTELLSNGALRGYITTITASELYTFGITASDGVNYDLESYSIFVYDRETLTADTDTITADNVASILSADISSLYSPILLTESGIIGNVKAQNNFALQLDAVDYNEDDLSYNITSGSLPPGLSLDTDSGWITGKVAQANLNYIDYTFTAQAYKTNNTDFVSNTESYTLRLLGQIDDTVTWLTEANLGIIYAGEVSDLKLQALPSNNQLIEYKLSANSIGALPPGLSLQVNGTIIGRPSFFQTNYINANLVSSFTVVPYNQNTEYINDARTFRLQVVKRTTEPYDNLYIQLLASPEQRQIYQDIINDPAIADNDNLYRPNDLWYGRNYLAKVLFLAGLNSETAADYIDAITLNHYWKTLLFGQIKTARATDDLANTIYEVVYIEIIDQQVNAEGVGPNVSITWPTNTENISSVYPNSFPNMIKRLEQGIGYEDKGVLPKWMTSRQEDGTVLGFTRALVLFYTQPDQSKKIAFRTQQYLEQFKLIDFTIDRYEWDNTLSKNDYVPASGIITGNIESNIILGNTGNISCSGTISSNTATVTVTGTNTLFAAELQKGSPIYVSSALIGVVGRIYSNTNLSLQTNVISNITNQSFTSIVNSTKFDTELKLGDTIVVADTIIGTVKYITDAANLTLFSNSSSNITDAQFSHIQQDLYLTPDRGNEYLKFPQTNILS